MSSSRLNLCLWLCSLSTLCSFIAWDLTLGFTLMLQPSSLSSPWLLARHFASCPMYPLDDFTLSFLTTTAKPLMALDHSFVNITLIPHGRGNNLHIAWAPFTIQQPYHDITAESTIFNESSLEPSGTNCHHESFMTMLFAILDNIYHSPHLSPISSLLSSFVIARIVHAHQAPRRALKSTPSVYPATFLGA
ncbi:hypothetical protein C8J56DRAFT_1043244 [Mycena floridula]|nr:hypothetical protein C8J56DRAFT_1043244 [Mycena floridula]